MAVALRQAQYSPIPLPPGARLSDISDWVVMDGRRLAPGGGVNGQAGDRWPGPQPAQVMRQPFTAQPGPVYRADQIGSPYQNPRQPYRRSGGFIVQTSMFPKPMAQGNLGPYVHQAGGTLSLGRPTSQSLTNRMAALIAMRGQMLQKKNKK